MKVREQECAGARSARRVLRCSKIAPGCWLSSAVTLCLTKKCSRQDAGAAATQPQLAARHTSTAHRIAKITSFIYTTHATTKAAQAPASEHIPRLTDDDWPDATANPPRCQQSTDCRACLGN
ncbi:unnamed protein product [Pieris macdunnoughi]|uniref:Uncharacterized protein n=1 Tax=Pieris macdunnoughi TaxID=345717 RepID=A0A821VYJ5_9NEOP|nr:unnamed protein product [Pieris macdunnoughi]